MHLFAHASGSVDTTTRNSIISSKQKSIKKERDSKSAFVYLIYNFYCFYYHIVLGDLSYSLFLV